MLVSSAKRKKCKTLDTLRELIFADFADLDNYIGQKQRIISGVEKSLICEIKFPRKLIPLRYIRKVIYIDIIIIIIIIY